MGDFVKLGTTPRADHILAKDALVRKAGRGDQALADAKLQAVNNHRDDLVLQSSRDVLVLSASAIKVPTGAMPQVGDHLSVTVDGKSYSGLVRYVDQESDPSAPKPSAAPAGNAAMEAAIREQQRALHAQQNRQAAGALAGLLIKNTTKDHGMIQRGLGW